VFWGYAVIKGFEPRVTRQIAWLAMLGVLLSGCLSVPSFKPSASIPQASSTTDPAVNSERERLVATFGGEYAAPGATLTILREIIERVVASSDDPNARYRVTVLNSPSINAFALPTGELYVTRGLLALANDTSELAAVMAHEVGHVTAKHAAQRAEFERQATAAMPETIADPTTAPSRFLLASFSRGQELEADEIGIRTIAKAGYDPYGAARFLVSLARQASFSGETRPAARFSFLSSHPSTPQRLSAALEIARNNVSAKSIEADRSRYLAALNGLAFGDDPSGGVIRGRRFLHPRMDFTILAPEGFTLENSSQAVIGVAGNGSQAMRLDTVRLGSIDLETSLANGWIEGAPSTDITSFSVGGFSGVTAVARGKEWVFRLAALRKGEDTFRIIFAAREMTPQLDRAFLAAIGSFRTLSPDEAQTIRPQKIMILTAGVDDSAASLAARGYLGENGIDRFMALNGLERPKLRADEVYKLVVSE